MAEPLRRLSGKNCNFVWTNDQEEAFVKVKNTVAENVFKRGFFDENDEIWLYTDASPVGLGAVMVQVKGLESGEKEARPIAFASKALTETEKRYPQTQREALAVVWGVEKFHFYLIGREFNLVVDHQPLAFIFSDDSRANKRATTRAESWAMRLQTYRFKVVVIRSEENIADYLSRESLHNLAPFEDEDSEYELGTLTVSVNSEFKNGMQAVTNADIARAAGKDKVFHMIRKAMQTEDWPPELARYAAFKDELIFGGEVLLRDNRFVAPTTLRNRLMRAAHLGHPGVVAMKRTLRRNTWWPGMDLDIETHVKQCQGCTMVARADLPEPMTRTIMPEEAWEYLAIDFNSPAALGVKLLVVTDYFSRATLVRAMKETDAGRTCDQLEDLFATYGYPACIRADNGPPFNSAEFKKWCNSRGITLIHSTALAPWMNGEVESQMRAIRKDLCIAVGSQTDWKLAMDQHIYAYNRRVHPTTNEKPIELLFSRRVRDLLPKWEGEEPSAGPDIEQARDKDRISKYASGVKMNSRRRASESKLTVGDVVFKENKPRKGLQPRFEPTPFKIIEKIGGTVVIQSADGTTYRRCTSQVKKAPVEPLQAEDVDQGNGDTDPEPLPADGGEPSTAEDPDEPGVTEPSETAGEEANEG